MPRFWRTWNEGWPSGGDDFTVQNRGAGVNVGDGLGGRFEFVGVAGATAGEQPDCVAVFYGFDAITVPFYFVFLGGAFEQLRHASGEHRCDEGRFAGHNRAQET